MLRCDPLDLLKEGDFPVAEIVSKEIMSLPMNPDLSDEEIEYALIRY